MTKSLTILGFLILGFDAADLTITGVALVAVVVLLIAAWLYGVFTAEFWICDEETSRQLDADEQEYARIHPPVAARSVHHWYEDIDLTETRS